jgi:hypothetical protein
MSLKTTTTFACAVLAMALLGSGAAQAQEATPDTWMQITTSKSHQQVREELVKARKDGTTRAWSAGYMEPSPVSRTRAQVQAETIAARNSGELQELNAEAYAFGQKPRAATALAAKR